MPRKPRRRPKPETDSSIPIGFSLISQTLYKLAHDAATRADDTSDQKLRWCASALWAMEQQFRRVKHYRDLPLLQQALQNKLSLTPSAAA